MESILFIVLVAIGYLCGSICSAIVVSRLFSLPDPCSEGSKNPGATNVLRLAGKKYAAMVLLGDMLKGFVPVLLGHILGAGPATLGFICLAAVLGHIYPVFFDFKGGKGVATALGAMLGFHFIVGVIIIAVWLLVANFLRYSSLASLIAIALIPLSAVSISKIDAFPPLMILAVFIIYKHRENINRLLDGREPKIALHNHQLKDVTDELLNEETAQAFDDEEKMDTPIHNEEPVITEVEPEIKAEPLNPQPPVEETDIPKK